MTSSFQKHSAGTKIVKHQVQLGNAYNPSFPLSSPDSDHRLSLGSNSNEDAARPQDVSDTLNLRSSSPSNMSVGGKKVLRPQDGRSQEKPEETVNKTKINARKKPRPGLQVVTDFSQTGFRTGNVVLSNVVVRQPDQKESRARSVVSQKGIRGLPSPLITGETQMISVLRDLINKNRAKKIKVTNTRSTVPNSNVAKTEQLPDRSSVVFGLSLPEEMASLHRHDDYLHSAVTLATPTTPQIVITPAPVERGLQIDRHLGGAETKRRPYSPTSIYSKSVSQYYHSDVRHDRSAAQDPASHHSQSNRRPSPSSPHQILPESCDTARPKSQGWWNLVLSPILSRAGTLKSKRTHEAGDVPPVPPIPAMTEKTLMMQTPRTNISPLTPRRTGLAKARMTPGSTWSEWEDDQTFADDDNASIDGVVPAVPHDCLSTDSHNDTHSVAYGPRGEGLAAEYYHACAVEQLAHVTYFECVNHSCTSGLPRLQSIYDTEKDMRSGSNNDTAQSSKLAVALNHGHTSAIVVASSASGKVANIDKAMGSDRRPQPQIHNEPNPARYKQIEEDLVSPNLREASTAAFSKARTINSEEPNSALPSSIKKPVDKRADTDVVPHIPQQSVIDSPGPISPEAIRTVAPLGALPLVTIQSQPAETTVPLLAPVPQVNHALVPPYQPAPAFLYHSHGQSEPYHFFVPPPQQHPINHQTPATTTQPVQPLSNSEVIANPADRDRKMSDKLSDKNTKADVTDKQEGKLKARLLAIFRCVDRTKPNQRKNNRRIIVVSSILMVLVITCVLFAIFFTRGHGEANPIASQWLNLSGFPPIPTGISTIAQPNLAASQTQCTASNTLWSCSLPKEDQASISPNQPDQPNFRFQIRFHNGTVPANLTIPLSRRDADSSADDLFVPNPTPPGQSDQAFLGNTTDNVTNPFEGETTPFFITFLDADSGNSSVSNTSKSLVKRQSDSDLLNAIPAPAIDTDGLAAPASMLPTTPLPLSQPIKLYNRGLNDEHYGFYMYYDKSIFLSAFSIQNGTTVRTNDSDSEDQSGGCTRQAANIRCTWSQTRFLVKIYTNTLFGATLLPGTGSNQTAAKQTDNATSSATDFSRPGSFPYPTTILLDRHGGDVNKKLLYCYGVDSESIVNDQKVLLSETRAFGGVAINPAPIVIGSSNSTFNSNLGGIDGGTGGCGCTWQNWS